MLVGCVPMDLPGENNAFVLYETSNILVNFNPFVHTEIPSAGQQSNRSYRKTFLNGAPMS